MYLCCCFFPSHIPAHRQGRMQTDTFGSFIFYITKVYGHKRHVSLLKLRSKSFPLPRSSTYLEAGQWSRASEVVRSGCPLALRVRESIFPCQYTAALPAGHFILEGGATPRNGRIMTVLHTSPRRYWHYLDEIWPRDEALSLLYNHHSRNQLC